MLPNWLYGKSKSKLATILGGGGVPADYEQVKAQVTQNTDDIAGIIGDTSIDRVTKLDPQPSECEWSFCHAYDNGILLQTMGIITLNVDISTNEFITVATLPVGHRPKTNRGLQCAMIKGSGTVYGTTLSIQTDGKVQFNVRPNMKANDQYLTYGVILL